MKKSFFCLHLFVGFMFLFPSFAMAEFYQYKDTEGNIVFTDDLSRVPVSQRTKMIKFDSVAPSANLSDSELDNNASGGKEKKQETDSVSAQRKRLENEYNRLQEARRLLMDEKDRVKTVEEQKAYNEKVNLLNQQIDEFSQEIQIFNTSVGL
jgi:hypothetical protein